MMKNVKVGDDVWFENKWVNGPVNGTVIELKETELPNSKTAPYAEINWKNGGTSGVLLENLFATKEELTAFIRARNTKKIQEIKNSLTDVNALVTYMFNTPLCAEEYTDYVAREAVKQRAKELLNLEL